MGQACQLFRNTLGNSNKRYYHNINTLSKNYKFVNISIGRYYMKENESKRLEKVEKENQALKVQLNRMEDILSKIYQDQKRENSYLTVQGSQDATQSYINHIQAHFTNCYLNKYAYTFIGTILCGVSVYLGIQIYGIHHGDTTLQEMATSLSFLQSIISLPIFLALSTKLFDRMSFKYLKRRGLHNLIEYKGSRFSPIPDKLKELTKTLKDKNLVYVETEPLLENKTE